jgi:Domain of unknown function (DUF1840)
MIYKFKSQTAADVIMLGANGEQVLCLLGRKPEPQGIVVSAQLGAAISALEAAVAADEAEFARRQAEAQAAGEPAPRREGVSLRQRAWPLLEMMRASLSAGQDVVWSV